MFQFAEITYFVLLLFYVHQSYVHTYKQSRTNLRVLIFSSNKIPFDEGLQELVQIHSYLQRIFSHVKTNSFGNPWLSYTTSV